MKKIALFLFVIISFISCSDKNNGNSSLTELYIIGTVHDSIEFINPQSLYAVIEQLEPDVILCELEAKFFEDNTYDLIQYPDLLSTNENIASYRYQQKYNIDLRPYEIDGRNEYYRSTSYFKKFEELFDKITEAYNNNTLRSKSSEEWERFLKLNSLLDVFTGNSTLKEINSELYVQYSEAKNEITYNTLLSITERDFPDKYENALELKSFWDKRNNAMAENILKWCEEYKGKKIIVLTGQQHKAQLITLLQPYLKKDNIQLKEFWEPDF